MPRRIGTERQTEARSVRIMMPEAVRGQSARRRSWPLSTRASSRGVRRAASAWAAHRTATATMLPR